MNWSFMYGFGFQGTVSASARGYVVGKAMGVASGATTTGQNITSAWTTPASPTSP